MANGSYLPRASLLVGALLAGCGDGATDLSTEAQVEEGSGSEVLFAGRGLELPEAVQDNVELLDPLADEWRSEILHERAKKVLTGFFKAIFDDERTSWDDVFAPADTFAGITALRARRLDPLYSGRGIEIRAGRPEEDLHDRDDIERLVAEFRQPFDAKGVRWFFKIIRVDLEGDERFGTSVIVHVDGHRGSERLQLNADWRIDWRAVVGGDGDHVVRIAGLRLNKFEEVRVERPFFAELTAHLLGDVAGYREDFLQSAGDTRLRIDRLLGSTFLGMQGLTLGDVNGDGLDDLYVPFQAGVANRVFLRRADGSIADATLRSRAGYLENTPSALLLDLDDDGDQDLVFGSDFGLGRAWNEGDGVFADPRIRRPSTIGEIYSLSAADADRDGDLDVYVCRYGASGILNAFPTPYHDAENGAPNLFFRNEGGRWSEATAELGFDQNNTRFSLASIWEDFDGDGLLDLYVANDFGRNNLYRNEGGTFRDVADEVGAADMAAGMGVSAGDFDADGDADLYVTNMFSSAGLRIVPQSDLFMGGENPEVHAHYQRHARGNTLLLNAGDGTFEDITDTAGVAVGGWGWGARWLDLNDDGLLDIYAPDGFITNRDPEDM